jgi:hypothetical protein
LIETGILNGILGKLDELDPDLPKYVEQVKQGFDEPAFFVMQLISGQTKGMDRRYKRSLLFNVHYFPNPDSLTKKEDCRTMGERLYEALEYINVNGPVRANDMKYEVVDEVLHFFLSFSVHLMKEKPTGTKMLNLEQEVHL